MAVREYSGEFLKPLYVCGLEIDIRESCGWLEANNAQEIR